MASFENSASDLKSPRPAAVRPRTPWLQLTLFGLAVAGTAWMASILGITQNHVVAVWPAAGLTLWGSWRYGWKAMPFIFAGYCLEGYLTNFDNSFAAMVNTIGSGLAGWLLRRRIQLRPDTRISDTMWLVLVGVVVVSLGTAIPGGYHYAQQVDLPAYQTGMLIMRWFISDVAGVLVVAPLLFAWSESRYAIGPRDFVRLEIWVACLTALLVFFASVWSTPHISQSAKILLIVGPTLLWLATRRNTFAALLASAIIGLTSLMMSAQVLYQDDQVLLETQLFIIMFIASVQLLQATSHYQHNLVAQLERNRSELEARVSQRTAELEVARARAEAADQAKSEFLANTSHEVRTPLNAILGMAEFLRQSDLSPGQREHADTILTAGRSLMSLLNDIIDLSKVEAGRLEITPHPTRLQDMLDEVRNLWLPVAQEKALTFEVQVEPDVPGHIELDDLRVKQCLSNLLSNAIKFTEAGSVSLTVSSRALPGGRCELAFAVTDTGIGMSEEATIRLFEPFEQLDASVTRRFGGTGLGLSISRRLVRMMGGDISVASKPGSGTTFVATLLATVLEAEPFAADHAGADRVAPVELQGRRVLVVEDNPVNMMVVKGHLKQQQFEFEEATNGVECLDRLADGEFDLVLLDVHMPVMDGIETIKRLRASDQPWSEVPVIALTADAMSDDRARLLSLGADGYASKPIDQAALLREISRVLDAAATARAPK